jgi:hypothetical protein
MGTIKFPPNLKALNQNLPKPKYDNDGKPGKSLRFIENDPIKVGSTKNIGLPSMKSIKSEKNINLINIASIKNIGADNTKTEAQKPKVLNKIASQKLIF